MDPSGEADHHGQCQYEFKQISSIHVFPNLEMKTVLREKMNVGSSVEMRLDKKNRNGRIFWKKTVF